MLLQGLLQADEPQRPATSGHRLLVPVRNDSHIPLRQDDLDHGAVHGYGYPRMWVDDRCSARRREQSGKTSFPHQNKKGPIFLMGSLRVVRRLGDISCYLLLIAQIVNMQSEQQ